MRDSKKFIQYVKDLRKEEYSTCMLHLDGTNFDKSWAIVAGWSEGFDPAYADSFSKKDSRVCVKLAYQPSNSAMQCDYDIDWQMPMLNDSDVDDTETAIYDDTDIESVVNNLISHFKLKYKDM